MAAAGASRWVTRSRSPLDSVGESNMRLDRDGQVVEEGCGLRGSSQRLVECFGGCHPAEGLSRAAVQFGGDGVEVGLGVGGEVAARVGCSVGSVRLVPAWDRDLGDPLGVARRLRSLAIVAMAEGDLDEAERLCEQRVSVFRSHGDRYGLSLALAFLGMTFQLAGDTERADPCVREALDLIRGSGSITSALYSLGSISFGAIAAGDIAGLRVHTTELAGLLRTLGGKHEDPGWLWWTAAALASGEGRYRSALRLAGAADAIARQNGRHLHEQLGKQVMPWLERARAQVGPAKADQLSVEGSRLTLDELLDEALRHPVHRRHGPLSARELEIADLIAQGLTNGEIAQSLVISPRTVESHVDHIKAKLGFARRARIVAWALERESGNGTNP
jgi:DNA-binding CsgD family transcriptional regulator